MFFNSHLRRVGLWQIRIMSGRRVVRVDGPAPNEIHTRSRRECRVLPGPWVPAEFAQSPGAE